MSVFRSAPKALGRAYFMVKHEKVSWPWCLASPLYSIHLVEIDFEAKHGWGSFHVKLKLISTFGSLISLICPSPNMCLNESLSFIQIKLFIYRLMLMGIWCCVFVFCRHYQPAHLMGIKFSSVPFTLDSVG